QRKQPGQRGADTPPTKKEKGVASLSFYGRLQARFAWPAKHGKYQAGSGDGKAGNHKTCSPLRAESSLTGQFPIRPNHLPDHKPNGYDYFHTQYADPSPISCKAYRRRLPDRPVHNPKQKLVRAAEKNIPQG